MKEGYKCLENVIGITLRKKLKIGAIVVIHTCGRSGSYNPHLHIILTNGGISEESGTWSDLGEYFPYKVIHKKWQWHLLNLMKALISGNKIKGLIDRLWRDYPDGFVANVSPGEVPKKSKGLAGYLAKYLASPPIAIRRILNYDGHQVTYYYKDHRTRARKIETVSCYSLLAGWCSKYCPRASSV